MTDPTEDPTTDRGTIEATILHERVNGYGMRLRWCPHCLRMNADETEPCDRRVLLALVEAAEAGDVPAELVAVARLVLE